MDQVKDVEELRELFTTEKLPLPALPSQLLQKLERTGPHSWSTQAAQTAPGDLAARIAEARRNVADYAEIGFSGHGINSWVMYVNLVHGPLAMFLQCRWGNVYDDVQRARRRIEGVAGFTTSLVEAVAKASQAGGIATGERLIVCFGDHYPSRWQWASLPDKWNEDGDFTLLAALGAAQECAARPGGPA
ncbi:MAG: hypothetical protein JWP36_2920 [Paucimonas sp.]|nr:hypothetical protein [Paucimonas sp.]